MTSVLIFGASGFLGSQVRRAIEADADVVCPSRTDCDLTICTPAELRELVGSVRPAAVVCCAGATSGTAAELLLGNAIVAAKLVEAVAATAPRARLVRLGSAAEYGPIPFGASVDEDVTAKPVSDYGISQATATRLIEVASAAGRVDSIVLRVFNPIGPGVPPTTLLGRAATLLARLAPDDSLRTGPLDAYRDFVDVRDVAAAVRAAVMVRAPRARVLNIASGRAVSVRDVLRLLIETSGLRVQIVEDQPSSPRTATVDWVRADISRAVSVLDWNPEHALSDSIRTVWSAAALGLAGRSPSRPGRTSGMQASVPGKQKEEQLT
ncbi:NAD(P)-dependent oxidoreductase [Micromonospora sp. U21]|uniref:NAD-dependent epimerase/dehydratase family protein n=1 Tax=Micromonospora sp. U21 TaxID=2824899 RepID=UPI001B372700|nr:NAD-dependent epimerase/dehydratase family protein [Micromonospora sp. U21]MBQ0901399.1 NAD-dependent epimerase/dehydratase family protein [Micromonospora sp. U21]